MLFRSLVATLNQNERHPLNVEIQVAQIFGATAGFMDRITVDRIPDFLAGLTQRVRSEAVQTLEKIKGGDWSDETQAELHNVVAQFADDFGYDLDEEGQPILDAGVGETSRAEEGLREVAVELEPEVATA